MSKFIPSALLLEVADRLGVALDYKYDYRKDAEAYDPFLDALQKEGWVARVTPAYCGLMNEGEKREVHTTHSDPVEVIWMAILTALDMEGE